MPRLLALDFDAGGAALVAVTIGQAGSLRIDHALSLPVDPAAPPLGDGAAPFGATLRDALQTAGIKPAPLFLVIGRDRVIVKDVIYPAGPTADEPMLVRYQAIRDLAEAADEVVMDYRPLGATPDGGRKAQAVFVRKSVVNAARTLANAAGLRLSAITPRPFAVAAAVSHVHTDNSAVAVLTTGEKAAEFLVVNGSGEVPFARAVPSAAFNNSASLTTELKRNLVVAGGANAIGGLLVAEAANAPNGWAEQLANDLPISVVTFDPLIGAGSAADQVPASARGRFLGPVGLARARATHRTLPINFAAPRQPKSEPAKNRTRVLLGVLAGVALAALLGMAGYLKLQDANETLALKKTEAADLKANLNRLSFDAARLAAVDQFLDREVVWLDELYDLADRTPDVTKMTVTLFDGNLQAIPKPRPGSAKAETPPAKVTLRVRANDSKLIQALADTFNSNPAYSGFRYSATADSAGKTAVATLEGTIRHRQPTDYTRRLTVPPPPSEDDDLTVAAEGEFP